MKVKCIANGTWTYKNTSRDWLGRIRTKDISDKGPKSGDVVTVVSDFWADGNKYYRLMEWPRQDGGGYNSKMFKPIDEEKDQFEEVKFEKIKEKNPASVN